MKQQRGLVILIVSSILLMAALVMSLVLFRGVFFQIKQAQNQIKLSQTHWLAEGGLACLYSQIKQPPDALELFNSEEYVDSVTLCKEAMELDNLTIEVLSSNRYVIRASKLNYAISNRLYLVAQVVHSSTQNIVGDSNPQSDAIRWLDGGWSVE